MSTKKLDADKGEPTVIIGAGRECCQSWVLECKDGPSPWQTGEQSRETRLLSGGLIRWASGCQAVRQPAPILEGSLQWGGTGCGQRRHVAEHQSCTCSCDDRDPGVCI